VVEAESAAAGGAIAVALLRPIAPSGR
jgi:hypothetical protein